MKIKEVLKIPRKTLSEKCLREILPYGKGFLFVDRINKLCKRSVESQKHFRKEEPYFREHFKDIPLTPGVFIIESAAQTCSVLVRNNIKNQENYHILLFKIKEATFKRPVFPDTDIKTAAKIKTVKNGVFTLSSVVKSKNEEVARMTFIVVAVKKEDFKKRWGLKTSQQE